MLIEKNTPLQSSNTFHIAANAHALVRIRSEADLYSLLADAEYGLASKKPKFVLGGGSNIVLTRDVQALVLKMEIQGRRLIEETEKYWIVEAGAGELWHDWVTWTLAQGYVGLENMALIPGTVGAAPVQNIGAYGVELQDRFHSLDAIDLQTGETFTFNAAQCAFGYRDSVFKNRLKDRAAIVRVRFALPKHAVWKPVLGYADIERKMAAQNCQNPTARQIFDWVCEVRRAKLPDPAVIGNVGSFFKNPTVTPEQCAEIIAKEPKLVHYLLGSGLCKLAAGWLIDSCGWKGKTLANGNGNGNAGVYEKQALVLVNHGNATGNEIMELAQAIQTSVQERFGVWLEPEPVVL
ncbi:MAG: hypothetical protein RIR79_1207 [Pseudomonadota bacterium]|jgi:UDP-N-acetylmuramate dehydrogenase